MSKVIIYKPLMTEKAISEAQKGVYGFKVLLSARKQEIVAEIEKLFNVKVKTIKTNIREGKIVRKGKRMIPKKTKNIKIAFVTLSKGKIDIFPQT